MAGNRKAQQKQTGGAEKGRLKGKGPAGESELASRIENGQGSRDDFLKRGEPLANQSKPPGNEGARTNAVGSADRAGRLGRQVGEKTGG